MKVYLVICMEQGRMAIYGAYADQEYAEYTSAILDTEYKKDKKDDNYYFSYVRPMEVIE